MSDFLVIGGTRVPIAAPSGADEEYQEIGGEVVRSFSGRLLSTVKGCGRVWRIQTPPLPESEAQMLAAVLAHGSPLLCSGALIGSDPVSCYARGVRTRPVAPLSRLRRVVEFELHEAAPMASPILFRLHAGEALPPGVLFSRASGATLIDRTGTLQEVGQNVPRIDWSHGRPALRLEGSSTNQIRNPRGEGAVLGTLGSGGALPTFWAPDAMGGLTWEVVGTGVEDGISYVDVRLHGTPTQTFAQMRFEGTTAVAAGPGQTWTGTFYSRLVAGSMSGIGEARVRIQERAAGGTVLDQDQTTFDPTDAPRLGLARRAHTRILASPDTAAVVLLLGVGGMTVGNAIDVTFRIGAPQIEQMPFATSPILPPIGAPAVATRATDQIMVTPAPTPQPMAVYLRFRERGTAFVGSFSADLFALSSSATRPLFQVDGTDTPGRYRVIHGLPGGVDSMSMTPVGAALDDDVEILATLSSDGAVRIHVSINGGPVQSGGAGPAIGLASAWGVDRLALGSSDAYTLLRDALVLRGAGWTMDDVRRLVR